MCVWVCLSRQLGLNQGKYWQLNLNHDEHLCIFPHWWMTHAHYLKKNKIKYFQRSYVSPAPVSHQSSLSLQTFFCDIYCAIMSYYSDTANSCVAMFLNFAIHMQMYSIPSLTTMLKKKKKEARAISAIQCWSPIMDEENCCEEWCLSTYFLHCIRLEIECLEPKPSPSSLSKCP